MPESTPYDRALDFIFSRTDLSKTQAANLAPENFDLKRMRDLLARLDDPHQDYPSIHIAGTKGKGSTAAMIAAALTASGRKTGLYTSPHLQDFTERIRVDGERIHPEILAGLVDEIKADVEAVPGITTFEIITTLAFVHFARAGVDAAVLEVGLGGRLDATNVVTPVVSVITSISFDHVPILGTTLPEIAGEKAGIIKPGIPVVTAPQRPEALEVIRMTAAVAGAPLQVVGEGIQFKTGRHSLEGQDFSVGYPGDAASNFSIPLLGPHQVTNAATAWAALQVAGAAGLNLTESEIAAGFSRVKWPGRFEVLRRDPFVIIDAAHNEESAARLLETLQEYVPGRKMTLIFGASSDKDIIQFLRILQPRINWLIATRSDHPRAMPPAEIAESAAALGLEAALTDDVESALEFGLAGQASDEVLLITGSVFVAGAAREAWFGLYPEV